jgi:hypothetical protein
MESLLNFLLQESFAFSSFIVYPPDLPQHTNDFYPDEDREGDLRRMDNIVKDDFEKLERFCRLLPTSP